MLAESLRAFWKCGEHVCQHCLSTKNDVCSRVTRVRGLDAENPAIVRAAQKYYIRKEMDKTADGLDP